MFLIRLAHRREVLVEFSIVSLTDSAAHSIGTLQYGVEDTLSFAQAGDLRFLFARPTDQKHLVEKVFGEWDPRNLDAVR